jgi:hypothetical protein
MVLPENIMVQIQGTALLTPVNRSSMPSDRYDLGCVCTDLSAGLETSILMLSLSMLLHTWYFTRNSICNGARCTYPSAISMQLQVEEHRNKQDLNHCILSTARVQLFKKHSSCGCVQNRLPSLCVGNARNEHF